MEQKKNRLFIILSGFFITNALLAEMIGVKIFSAEKTVGLDPAHLPILGFEMDFNLTAGVIIWPAVFLTTDLINEYFGKPGVRFISYFTAALITFAFLVLNMAINLPPAEWWMETNNKDATGNAFNINYAFARIFGQGQKIIFASLIAFLVGQLVDVFVFQRLRSVTKGKYLWLRATGSTLVSQFVDSFLVLYIAFYDQFTGKQIIAIGLTNYIYKFAVAILLTPLIYAAHALIDRYLGKRDAERLTSEAAAKGGGFF